MVHGDPRLENLPAGLGGEHLVLDLGFAARRPRVHDLAYAGAWILLGPDDTATAIATEPSDTVTQLRSCITAYEQGAGALTAVERGAFDGYLAGVCLYQSTVAAHLPDPDAHLSRPGIRKMLAIARQLVTQPRKFL
ncbi:hypothetical protein GCM10009817_12570 [Terrabacter lapilli]|uniref:Phosphotransferase family enzyme n=1 Tax=Terrabacter lapilli TaxID=436231 RepID=A0ABN2RS06_9MICO